MSQKDVLYIDIEDDITAIIEKATSSKNPITALVLPKRYGVLQSLVNMKLLKKAVDKAGKKIVLITSESNLLPVAGMAGVHVADSLQSRPAVPAVDAVVPDEDTVIDESDQPVETLPAKEETASNSKSSKSKPAASDKTKDKKPKSAKDPKATAIADDNADGKIPNFNRFKKKILIGVGAVLLLIILWVVGYIILPTATIAIRAQTTRVDTNLDIALSSSAESDNVEEKVLATEKKELTKSVSQDFQATGEKDIGKKASGTIDVTNNCFNPGTLPRGTTFTAASGLKFVSTQAVSVPTAVPVQGDCQATSASVPVTANNSGDKFNLAPTSYTIASYSSSDVSGFGSQMSGGTSEVVKVITQADIDSATNKLLEKKDEKTISELEDMFADDVYVIDETFDANNGPVTSDPAVGQQANGGTLTAEFVYSVSGVNRDNLEKILENDQLSKVNSADQSILKNGLDEATITISGDGEQQIMNIKTSGYAGPEINLENLKEEIKGKRYGEVETIVKSKEGVRDVTIDSSPFWVFSAPDRTSKINIEIEVSDTLQ